MTAAARRALPTADRATLAALQRGRDWMWIAGNHDPDPADGVGGSFAAMLALGGLGVPPRAVGVEAADGEIAGHLHPVARVAVRGRGIGRRCFASDGRRMVMPAFGAYAGGLNVRHRAFAGAVRHGLHGASAGRTPALRVRRRALPERLARISHAPCRPHRV